MPTIEPHTLKLIRDALDKAREELNYIWVAPSSTGDKELIQNSIDEVIDLLEDLD